MPRLRKTFTEALSSAKDMMGKGEAIEVAAKDAAKQFSEDENMLILYLNREHQEPKGKEKKIKVSERKKYCYNGPAEIICLNGTVAQINICETVTAADHNDAKEKIYEKFFNNRIPVSVKKTNWRRYMQAAE